MVIPPPTPTAIELARRIGRMHDDGAGEEALEVYRAGDPSPFSFTKPGRPKVGRGGYLERGAGSGRAFTPGTVDTAWSSVHDKCMAVKTITIDLEAYDALARHKRPGQSFSQVIKEHFGRTKNVDAFRAALGGAPLSESTIAAVERVVRSRRRSPARVPAL